MRSLSSSTVRGFTFVELLVTVAVVTLVFGGLILSIQFIAKLISDTKVGTSAVSLANERIEYIRSLTYNDVGTLAGIPNGLIPQNATTSLNGFLFHERIVVQYVDSPDDGRGASDSNGIVADYKEVKVEYSWQGENGTSTIFLLTNIVPPGIESVTGGGTLIVNVFDNDVLPVLGAAVRIYNNTTTSTIDTIRYTNSEGTAIFSGAPAAANYQITVSKLGYSTDQTYTATTTNPNPVTSHVAVLTSAVSTMNFQIDELSDLLIRTVGPATLNSISESFSDSSGIATSTSTSVGGGELMLAGGAGAYMSSGIALSVSTTPATIMRWDSVVWNFETPSSTTLLLRVYAVTGTSTYTLIPNTDLLGNSVGFGRGSINISGLSVATYPTIALGVTMTSSNVMVTPRLRDFDIRYVISEPAIGSVLLAMQGAKIIGTTVALAPIYKYKNNHTTNGSGEIRLTDIEWDSYTVELGTGTYNIKEACSNIPYELNPAVDETLRLTLIPSSTYSLRVRVVDTAGNPIIGEDVTLSRSGFSDSKETSSCGQVFFNSGLGVNTDYVINVSAYGYSSQTITDITIDGTESLAVTLVSS